MSIKKRRVSKNQNWIHLNFYFLDIERRDCKGYWKGKVKDVGRKPRTYVFLEAKKKDYIKKVSLVNGVNCGWKVKLNWMKNCSLDLLEGTWA